MQMNDSFALQEDIVDLIPRLRRFAFGLTGNSTDADDVVQIALERSLTRLHQYKPGTRLDSWMFRIVQNCWFNECRRNQRTETGMDMTDLERLPNAPVADHSQRHDQLRDITHAMSHLNDDQRSLVMTVLVEGHSYKDAADLFEIPIGTVMSRLTRARKTLMAILSDDGAEE